MRRLLFWASAWTIVYTYVGYPLLLAIRASIAPHAWRRAEITPTLSVIIVAHNEASVIERKLESVRRADYPSDSIEVLVASDGSTDGTAELARATGGADRVLDLPRGGKAAGLNAAIAQARGEVLLFTDANSMLERSSLRSIVRSFADPDIGGVAGDQQYSGAGDGSRGERTYWSLDRRLKDLESRAGSTISATGALYAIRRELVQTVPDDVTDDFFQSVGVVKAGKRLVFEPAAVAFEAPRDDEAKEFSRKIRIITRGLTAVIRHRATMDPRRYGFYAVQMLTHKVMRRLAFLPLSIMAVAAPTLWRAGAVYRVAAVAQGALYAGGLLGILIRASPQGRSRLLSLPAFFLLANAASARAVLNIVRGHRVAMWSPSHDEPQS